MTAKAFGSEFLMAVNRTRILYTTDQKNGCWLYVNFKSGHPLTLLQIAPVFSHSRQHRHDNINLSHDTSGLSEGDLLLHVT